MYSSTVSCTAAFVPLAEKTRRANGNKGVAEGGEGGGGRGTALRLLLMYVHKCRVARDGSTAVPQCRIGIGIGIGCRATQPSVQVTFGACPPPPPVLVAFCVFSSVLL